MGSAKGVQDSIAILFTPSVVFSGTQGTVTYTKQSGSLMFQNRIVQQNGTPYGVWYVIIATTIVFTFTGSTGNVSVINVPLAIPSSEVLENRIAVLKDSSGITAPANATGQPSSQVTYPSTSPLTMNLVYKNNSGNYSPLTVANLSGTVTIGISHEVITSTPPY